MRHLQKIFALCLLSVFSWMHAQPTERGYIILEGDLTLDANKSIQGFPFVVMSIRNAEYPSKEPKADYYIEYWTTSGKKIKGPMALMETSSDPYPVMWKAIVPTMEDGVGYRILKEGKEVYSEKVPAKNERLDLGIEDIGGGKFRISGTGFHSIFVLPDGDSEWFAEFVPKDKIYKLPDQIIKKETPVWLMLQVCKGMRRHVARYRWDPNPQEPAGTH